VILVAEHSEEGAMGVVLNRATDVPAAEALPALSDVLAPDESLFVGGPVQGEAALALAEFEHPDSSSAVVFGSIGFLGGDLRAEDLPGVRRARLYAGYAGWGPGQLEGELEASSWIVEPATATDVFTEEPEQLWRHVLRRKGGDYALLALMPVDPSAN
jgi:putative transcriptional regulator